MNETILSRCKDRLDNLQQAHEPFIYIDSTLQKLYLAAPAGVLRVFDISTAERGMGNVEGSFKTPQGIHRICCKIGENAPAMRIFKDRNDTGINWTPDMSGDNMILSRILRLEGMEYGINRGPGIDSFERYIYIHGTNRESDIGKPFSHGCICMRNNDIIDLFDSVKEGTFVIID